MRTDKGIVALDWTAQLVAAIRLRWDTWRPLFEGPAWVELLLLIMADDRDPDRPAAV